MMIFSYHLIWMKKQLKLWLIELYSLNFSHSISLYPHLSSPLYISYFILFQMSNSMNVKEVTKLDAFLASEERYKY